MRIRFITLTIMAMMLIGTSLQAQNAAADYERQIVGTYAKRDMKALDRLLADYYKSGLYPVDVLMYNYNELQGMEDWISLAPLHNRAYLAAIRVMRGFLPDAVFIGCFESLCCHVQSSCGNVRKSDSVNQICLICPHTYTCQNGSG